MSDTRDDLFAAVREMDRRGLVSRSSGNASVRLDPVEGAERYLITPAFLPYSQMEPSDLVEIDGDIDPVDGEGIPSTESALHVALYRSRPDAGAVVHTHSLYSSAAAASGRRIPPIVDEMVLYLGGAVEVARYGFPGSEELAAAAVEAIGDRRAVLLRNHGMCAVGGTIREALDAAVLVERVAQIHALAEIGGGAAILPAEAIEAERAAYLMRYLPDSR